MLRVVRFTGPLGVAAIVLGFSKLHASRVADPPYDFSSSPRFPWALAFIVATIVGGYALGLPDLVRSRKAAASASIAAPLIGVGAVSVLQLASGQPLLPRAVMFATVLVTPAWWMLCCAALGDARAGARARERVVVVASADDIARLTDDLSNQAEREAEILGSLTTDGPETDPYSGRALLDLCASSNATVVVLSRSATDDELLMAQAALLHGDGVRIRTLGLFYEQWIGKLPLSEVERVSMMFDIGELHRARYGRIKRIVDVIVSTALVPVLAALAVIVWCLNPLLNRGSLWYRQPRVGRNGKAFSILKFRTMLAVPSTEEAWTQVGDARVTKLGRILRTTHLDELPQVINILRGELSLIGPRPEQPDFVAELTAKLPYYNVRHLVRPGLTGWAQVKYSYGSTTEDALQKLQYEVYYLRRQSLRLDAVIAWRTIRAVALRQGR